MHIGRLGVTDVFQYTFKFWIGQFLEDSPEKNGKNSISYTHTIYNI